MQNISNNQNYNSAEKALRRVCGMESLYSVVKTDSDWGCHKSAFVYRIPTFFIERVSRTVTTNQIRELKFN